ncbi:MAG: hypothetical protein WKG01_29460 [Kofleriaceae bacterium]
MAKPPSRPKSKRGAKASRSAFRAKPAKPKPKRKAPAKPKARAKPRTKPKARARPRAVTTFGELVLGKITVPSGRVGIFDLGLIGYLPRPALEPAIVIADVPADRPLPVIDARLGRGRFSDSWDQVSIVLGDGVVSSSKKLGEAAADFARLACMDLALLDHWEHEDSLDGRADFVFSGRDERLLAAAMVAPRQADGYGWVDVKLADAEARSDVAARKKAENKWLLTMELRPHSHHYQIAAASRANRLGAGTLELAGAQMLMFLTTWGNGVFPIYLDRDAADRPVRIRIQLASADARSMAAAEARR